jgi:hypothetical protein
MIEIEKIMHDLKSAIESWHSNDLGCFDEKKYDETNLSEIVQKLAYHNYYCWHLLENYELDTQENVNFVWESGVYHNKSRNTCMQNIDQTYVDIQNENSDYNSEGMGSLFDKFTNDFIKYLHLVSLNDERAESFKKQVDFHQTCIQGISYKICAGEKRIIVFQKFKISYRNF